jgi:hypothetical protein
LVLYFLIGVEIARLRDEFKLTEDSDHIQLTSNVSSHHTPFENPNGSVITTVEATKPKSSHGYDSGVTSETSVERSITLRPDSSRPFPPNYQLPTQRRMSFRQYILMPSLFFLALLTTWVTPTINRVSAFIHPGSESYSLLLAVSALGSLRGFWNGVIFVTMGMKGWKQRAVERRTRYKVSQRILSQPCSYPSRNADSPTSQGTASHKLEFQPIIQLIENME